MKVIYDKKDDKYIVNLENYENIVVLNTNEIVKAREYFIDHMTWMFDQAIREQLKD